MDSLFRGLRNPFELWGATSAASMSVISPPESRLAVRMRRFHMDQAVLRQENLLHSDYLFLDSVSLPCPSTWGHLEVVEVTIWTATYTAHLCALEWLQYSVSCWKVSWDTDCLLVRLACLMIETPVMNFSLITCWGLCFLQKGPPAVPAVRCHGTRLQNRITAITC